MGSFDSQHHNSIMTVHSLISAPQLGTNHQQKEDHNEEKVREHLVPELVWVYLVPAGVGDDGADGLTGLARHGPRLGVDQPPHLCSTLHCGRRWFSSRYQLYEHLFSRSRASTSPPTRRHKMVSSDSRQGSLFWLYKPDKVLLGAGTLGHQIFSISSPN